MVTSPEEICLARVSEDMDHAMKKVELCARHVGLLIEEDNKNMGRYWHKEAESMADIAIVDNDSRNGSKRIISLVLGVVITALVTWGLVVLFSNGSTGYTAMGGLILAVFCLLLIKTLYSYCMDVGKAKRLESYKDKKFREMYTEMYAAKMAQIQADLEILSDHIGYETSDDGNEVNTKETMNMEDQHDYRTANFTVASGSSVEMEV